MHILLEHSYDSQRNEKRAQLADVIGSSQSREARICSVRSDSPAEGLPSSDRSHSSSRRIRPSWRCLAAAIVARSTRGTGRKPYPSCLAGGSIDKTVQLWDWPPPVQLAPRRQGTPTSSPRLGSAPVEPSSQAAGISPCGLWDVATLLAAATVGLELWEGLCGRRRGHWWLGT